MRDQVVMSKVNGELAIAVPLFRWDQENEIANLAGYSISITNERPVAYAIEGSVDGDSFCQLMNTAFVTANLEFLGDL